MNATIKSEDEGREEREEKEADEVGTKPINAKEVSTKATVEEEATVKEAIAQVIADVEAMTTEMVEDSKAAQATSPGE